ncbi:MAG: ornithine cyclodeaminase family protein [Vulcanimicrobiota bacterium]
MGCKTVLLNRSEVMRLLDASALVEMLADAFRAHSADGTDPGHRFPAPLPGPGDMVILAPGLTSDIPAYTVKVHAKFPDSNPSIRGVLHLHDLDNGDLLAVMDSSYLTAVRTSLTAALATDLLARSQADRVAVIGAGVQGWYQLRYLLQMRRLKEIFVFDIIKSRAEKFVELLQQRSDLTARACSALTDALAACDIVLCSTWAREPFLTRDLILPGTHITTLGADQPGKAEVDRTVLRKALVFCDDRKLALEMGLVGNVGLGPKTIAAELGEVLAGTHKGRSTDKQITVYGAVGLPFQDLIAAWQVYREARRKGVGRTFDFLT